MAGEVDRTFPVNRVPSGRIGHTEILHLQSDANDRFVRRQVNDAPGGFPGGTTGGPANDADFLESSVCDRSFELRCTELIAIPAQAVLPGKPASGGRGQGAFHFGLFPGGHHGDAEATAVHSQIVRQVRVLQKVEHQVRFDVRRQILGRIIDDRR